MIDKAMEITHAQENQSRAEQYYELFLQWKEAAADFDRADTNLDVANERQKEARQKLLSTVGDNQPRKLFQVGDVLLDVERKDGDKLMITVREIEPLK